jgi:hypothetical protein
VVDQQQRTDLEFNPPLDAGIKRAVEVLVKAGIETYESCEGGKGHSYPEPTVCFFGTPGAGYRALAVALDHDLPVKAIKRVWSIIDGEASGPFWEMVFWRKLK